MFTELNILDQVGLVVCRVSSYFTIVFLLFLASARGSNLRGNDLHLTNLT